MWFFGCQKSKWNNRGRKGVAVWGQWQSEVILILITRGTCEKKKEGEGLPRKRSGKWGSQTEIEGNTGGQCGHKVEKI